jgi:hypothetical protein
VGIGRSAGVDVWFAEVHVCSTEVDVWFSWIPTRRLNVDVSGAGVLATSAHVDVSVAEFHATLAAFWGLGADVETWRAASHTSAVVALRSTRRRAKPPLQSR